MSNNIIYRISAVNLLSSVLRDINTEADATDNKMSTLGKTITAALSISAVIEFGKSIIETTNKLEALKNQLNFASGSAEQGAKDFEYIKNISDEMGLNFESASNSFAKFEGATRGTAIAGEETKRVFEGISAAGTVMHLTSEEMGGALTALQQMMSKGKVSAEELNGQLGERIPGAFGLASRAMGVSTSKLMDMMKAGQVISEDFLPKFARQLKEEFGPGLETAANSGMAQMNRLSNSWLFLQQSFGEATAGIQMSLIESLTGILNFFTEHMDVIKSAIVGLTVALGAFAVVWTILNANIIMATASAWLFFAAENAVLLGIPLLIGGAASAASYFNITLQDVGDTLMFIWELIKGLGKAILAPFMLLYDIITKGLVEGLKTFQKQGEEVGSDIIKSYQNIGVKSAKEAETKTGKKTTPTGTPPIIGAGAKGTKSLTAGVSGPKITTINITVGSLIHDFSIRTTNMKEGVSKAKDMVTTALSQSLSDSQLIVQ